MESNKVRKLPHKQFVRLKNLVSRLHKQMTYEWPGYYEIERLRSIEARLQEHDVAVALETQQK